MNKNYSITSIWSLMDCNNAINSSLRSGEIFKLLRFFVLMLILSLDKFPELNGSAVVL